MYKKKQNKRAEYIVELHISTREFFFNTREVPREARAVSECFSHFSIVLTHFQMLMLLNNGQKKELFSVKRHLSKIRMGQTKK